MSILEEMHPLQNFATQQQFDELKQRLNDAIGRGYVEAIPVIKRWDVPVEEEWYRDKQTGEIFSLVAPDPPSDGRWERVDIESFQTIQPRLQ
jgi:hypothetical protein